MHFCSALLLIAVRSHTDSVQSSPFVRSPEARVLRVARRRLARGGREARAAAVPSAHPVRRGRLAVRRALYARAAARLARRGRATGADLAVGQRLLPRTLFHHDL